ncbi:oxygenase MpaB family protein [Archangium primigenium]|uniref:oxygenase MpaB family protein n=1 Tax=[Archangium] primigenium TaxID=2792470 RepID=UPI00195DCF25|nr:oxygenase MpaB family protein [Archangium primigenium]MBM7119493.1 DUF2236 domain-containing protein [Archangium primigenium]
MSRDFLMRDAAETHRLLDAMREVCDPLADTVIEELFARGQVASANALMKHLVAHVSLDQEQMPEPLRSYFVRSGRLPEWVDPALLDEGQAMFNRCGPLMVVGLVCAALPTCYAGAQGVQVLHLTARMEKDVLRRVVETAQMVVDVMSPEGLAPEGRGLRDAQKVRLMHAAVRYLVRGSGRWDPAWGQPVNQEDMAGTLFTFSVVTLRALVRLGYTPTRREAQAYYHAWRVVGFLMGVDERLLPEHVDDGDVLADLIFSRVFAPSEEGQAMTRVLVERLDHLLPGHLFEGASATLIRYLVGDDTAELLALPRTEGGSRLLEPLRALGRMMEEGSEGGGVMARVFELFGRKLLESIVWVGRRGEGDRSPFYIPATLRESWRVGAEEGQPVGAA